MYNNYKIMHACMYDNYNYFVFQIIIIIVHLSLCCIAMHELCTILQVQAEFTMMCGEEAVTTIATKWRFYVPVVLRQGGVEAAQSRDSEQDDYRALELIDSRLRPGGPGAKSPAAFSPV